MPSQNSNVQFCYINQNLPDTYNDNTIYFDEINKNIKVGDIEIANYYSKEDSIPTIHITGNITWGINTYNLTNTFSNFSNFLELETLAGTGKEIVLIIDSYSHARTSTYYINGTSGYLYFPINIFDNSKIAGTFEIAPNGDYLTINYFAPILPENNQSNLTLYIQDTDNDIINQGGTQIFQSILFVNEVSWADWRRVLQNLWSEILDNNYNLKIVWQPRNIPTKFFVLTNYEIDYDTSSFIFKTVLYNDKILKIIVQPEDELITAIVSSNKTILNFNTNNNPFSDALTITPTALITWSEVAKNDNKLELQVYSTNNMMFKSTNYFISKTLQGVTPTYITFGPILSPDGAQYKANVMFEAPTIDTSSVTSCTIEQIT